MGNFEFFREINFLIAFPIVGPLVFLRRSATTNFKCFIKLSSRYRCIYIKQHATISIKTLTQFAVTLIIKVEVVSGGTKGWLEMMTSSLLRTCCRNWSCWQLLLGNWIGNCQLLNMWFGTCCGCSCCIHWFGARTKLFLLVVCININFGPVVIFK